TLHPGRPAHTPHTGTSDKPLPGPATTLRPQPAARAGLAIPRSLPPLPPAKPQVQVERPQRSEDERPGGAARRRPYSAARKALVHPDLAPEAPAWNEPETTTRQQQQRGLVLYDLPVVGVPVRSGAYRVGLRAGVGFA